MVKRVQVHPDSPIALTPSSWFQNVVSGIIHDSSDVFSEHPDVISVPLRCRFPVGGPVNKEGKNASETELISLQSLILRDTRWLGAAA